MKTHDFLLAIETEEIPDWMIPGALADLQRLFLEAVGSVPQAGQGAGCGPGGPPHSYVETYATPRRLVLVARQIPEKEPDAKETLTGPPVSAGPKAAEGFARKLGIDPAQLKRVTTPKGEYFTHTRKVKGRRTRDLLAAALPGVVLGIDWPKTMTWTSRTGPRFIRPIRRLIALYGDRVVPFEIAGVASSNVASGHRRLGRDIRKVISFEDLVSRLRDNGVILDPAERRARIESGMAGWRARPNPQLLETLVHITEYPTPLLGNFDPQYLTLPEEVLVTVMQHHQKYFSVEDENGRLAPHFIAVMNIADDADGLVRHGNERVLRARFNDARFFWETDQKRPLAQRVDDLKHVTFHKDLGSYYDKTQRNVEWVRRLGGNEHAQRAALLGKCDLTTELVKEFTELQGVVGGLYARAQGEPEPVALAIYDQYEPVPRTPEGQIVALADRLDTLESFFRLGLMPTGSKDPFALRRAALGTVRILIESRHQLPLRDLAGLRSQLPGASGGDLADAAPVPSAGSSPPGVAGWKGGQNNLGPLPGLYDFLLERVRHYFSERYAYDEINAVLAGRWEALPDLAERLDAIHQVRPTPDFEPLAASFKRIRNILRQAGFTSDAVPDPALLEPGPERDLYDHACRIRDHASGLSYQDALAAIATLRPQVDLFFDKVLVMAPDPAIRNNRLAFLSQLLRDFSTIADFSEIVISGD